MIYCLETCYHKFGSNSCIAQMILLNNKPSIDQEFVNRHCVTMNRCYDILLTQEFSIGHFIEEFFTRSIVVGTWQ